MRMRCQFVLVFMFKLLAAIGGDVQFGILLSALSSEGTRYDYNRLTASGDFWKLSSAIGLYYEITTELLKTCQSRYKDQECCYTTQALTGVPC
ncbi:hypothetical protein DL93DRAFT_2089705 [Clavulina sp. PMI_390]|nr:hypothetical protein DL93DRAFT_2089705 [Clavulina sp. PMI_390]